MLEQGDVEQRIIQQSLREKVPLPERIQNAPSLAWGLELYYSAFMDLMSSRMFGMNVGPIWWQTVQDYCREHGLSEEQTEDMHFFIQQMDLVYLKKLQEKK